MSDDVINAFTDNMSFICELIPELTHTIGFNQNTPYHCYDVFTHTLYSIQNAPKDIHLRLTMLFHDIAKPLCYSEKDGVGHFYGHPQKSADITKEILRKFGYNEDIILIVTQLIFYHDAQIRPRRKQIVRWLNRIGEDRFRQLLEVRRADTLAQAPEYQNSKLDDLIMIPAIIDDVLEQQKRFSLKDLAVNGRDLVDLGISESVQVGIILNKIYNMVINGDIENDKEKLLDVVKQDYL